MVETIRHGAHEPVLAPARFLIVEAPYYADLAAMLMAGAEAALTAAQAIFDVVRVPGSLEIPVAIRICVAAAARRGKPYAGAVALGCVMRGETYHFEVVSNESARGVMAIGIDLGLPIGNGILTVENEAQALRRADPAQGDKGGEAARAALILWRIGKDAEASR